MNLENWQSADPGLCYKRSLRFLKLNQKWDSHAREILMSNLLNLASHGYDEAESIYGLCVLTGLLEPLEQEKVASSHVENNDNNKRFK